MIKKGFSRLGVGLLYLISLLPYPVLFFIADILFVLLYHLTGYRRKVVQQNLANAFPEKSINERLAIEKKYYRFLADLIMETIKLYSISADETIKRVDFRDHLLKDNEAFKSGKSIIAAVGHYGNWESGCLRMGLVEERKCIIAYKPLSNNIFDKFFYDLRSRFGTLMVPMKNTFRTVVAHRRQHTLTVLAGDQTPSRDEVTYFTNFLNQPTAVFLGVEKLAKATDSLVVFCDVRRVGRGYYTCTFVPLFDNPKDTAEYEITNAHVQYLENVIREEPEFWLWSHRRWKFKPEDLNKHE
ncbi:lysophospholipid acyltransferase family protein [uncultured Mucilaginibacter sp.]|uniref:lysophospholipid acyltransferase family protein n=1 Tax=uncultured Mucilaginibacter sp. TaxID=797541 RepID=UPI0025CE38BC|nr:lysophospholipid acyltransferase family protein [uncultured Mucilaginibacter sp.]